MMYSPCTTCKFFHDQQARVTKMRSWIVAMIYVQPVRHLQPKTSNPTCHSCAKAQRNKIDWNFEGGSRLSQFCDHSFDGSTLERNSTAAHQSFHRIGIKAKCSFSSLISHLIIMINWSPLLFYLWAETHFVRSSLFRLLLLSFSTRRLVASTSSSSLSHLSDCHWHLLWWCSVA